MPEVTCSLDRAGLRVIDVLLVEDDPGDVLMTTEAFELSPVHSTLHVVSDGEQALRFLRRTGEFTGAPRPGLILLDLNLPRRNGLEVLAELKADPDLLTIPVVIFSTSQAETDIAASYQLHANAYITKPVSLDLFTEAIRQVDDFFLTLVKLPAEDGKRGPRAAPESRRRVREGDEDAADALEGAGGLGAEVATVLSSSHKCKRGMRPAQPGGEGLSSWYRSKGRYPTAPARRPVRRRRIQDVHVDQGIVPADDGPPLGHVCRRG
jgi:CheY-like chemotaxis protein